MWDGVTYVEPNYAPIIHEGHEPATVVIVNAGPASIRVSVWSMTQPEGRADIDMELRAGNTRSVSGKLIRAGLAFDRSQDPDSFPDPPFAALGWRVVR